MPRCICVPNLKFLGSKFMNGVQNLQILLLNFQHTPYGKILLSVTWDISRYICVQNLMFLATPVQNLWKGSKIYKFDPWTPITPLWGNSSSMRWDMPRSICVPNLKFLCIPIPNLWKGSKIYKFGPWTPTTPYLGEFCYQWDGTCQHLSVYQIWSISIFARFKFMGFVMIHTANSSPCGRGTLWLQECLERTAGGHSCDNRLCCF